MVLIAGKTLPSLSNSLYQLVVIGDLRTFVCTYIRRVQRMPLLNFSSTQTPTKRNIMLRSRFFLVRRPSTGKAYHDRTYVTYGYLVRTKYTYPQLTANKTGVVLETLRKSGDR